MNINNVTGHTDVFLCSILTNKLLCNTLWSALLASKKAMNTFLLILVQYVTNSLKAKLIKHKHSRYYFWKQIAGSYWQEIPQIIIIIIIIIIRAFVRRTMSASELNLRRRQFCRTISDSLDTSGETEIVIHMYIPSCSGVPMFVGQWWNNDAFAEVTWNEIQL